MAEQGVTLQRRLWADDVELPSLQALGLLAETDARDDTVFGDIARSAAPGLSTVRLEGAGLFTAGASGDLDPTMATKRGLLVPVTLAPLTGAAGEICYLFQATEATYRVQAAVGELCRADFSATGAGGQGGLVRGALLAVGQQSASGAGTAYNLGSVASGQRLYAALHVLSGTGTLDVVIESDDASGMLTPLTRITFAQVTGPAGQWASPIAGPITDTWWRAKWTITGGPWTFVVSMGIK